MSSAASWESGGSWEIEPVAPQETRWRNERTLRALLIAWNLGQDLCRATGKVKSDLLIFKRLFSNLVSNHVPRDTERSRDPFREK